MKIMGHEEFQRHQLRARGIHPGDELAAYERFSRRLGIALVLLSAFAAAYFAIQFLR